MFATVLNQLAYFKREEGQDLIEYAMIIALIVIAAIVGMDAVGKAIAGMWTTIAGLLGGGPTLSMLSVIFVIQDLRSAGGLTRAHFQIHRHNFSQGLRKLYDFEVAQ